MNSIWKRSLSLLLAVVMVVGMVPMSVFATEEEACAHENVEYINEPADCIWEGYYAEYCNDCGEYLCEEFIPAAGHSWEENVCTACGETLAVEEEETEQEEPIEEPSEEVPEEITEELTSVEMPVDFALKNNGTLEGIIWLDKNRDNDLMTKVMEGGLRDMVLTAVNMHGSSEKVYYNSADGSKKNVADLLDLYDMYDELKDVLTGEATLAFTIGSGTSAKVAYVTLKNIAHLTFDISVPAVENAGEPEDIKAMVESVLNDAVINVYHGGDEIAWELLPEQLCTVELYNPGSYTWPALTKSAKTNASVTITIRDSVDGTTEMSASANVTLKDTTPVYNVTFMSNGSVYNAYTVIEGQNLPEVEEPSRSFYNFQGWTENDSTNPVKEVEGEYYYVVKGDLGEQVTFAEVKATDIQKDAVYYAVWTPVMDNNGDGIADQLQQFNVTYLVDGNAYERIPHKYGEKTKMPETDPTDPTGNRIFLGWGLDDDTDDVAVADTVRGHVTYVAKWATKDYIIVVFKMDRVGNTPVTQKFAVLDGEEVQELKYDFLDGWYDESGEKFDFDQPITTALAEDGYLYLTGTLKGYDNGGLKDVMDGTAEDAYANHTFYIYEQDTEGKWDWTIQHEADTEYEQDPETKVDFDEVYLPDAKDNYVKHIGWKEYSFEGTEYAKDTMIIPVVEEDFNNNDIADTNEAAQLILPEGAAVESSDSLGLPASVPAEYGITEVPNLTVPGTMTTAMGTVSITGMQEDGTFLYNKVFNNRENNAATILVATPAANHYVAKILVGSNELDLNSEDVAVYDASNDSYTVNLSNLSQPAAMAAETEKVKVEVVFEAAEIKFKDSIDLKPGQSIDSAEAVYNAVVNAPELNEGDTVEVKYVARKAQEKVTVSVKALRQDIEFRYGEVGKKLMEKMWPGDTVTVNLTEVTKPVTYQHEGMVKTPQQVVDSYILELQDASITQLAGTLTVLDATIQSKLNDVNSGAYIRPFLYNADGDLEETIKVTYKGSGRTISGEKTYTLTDNRAETSITIGNKTFNHGDFTDAQLVTDAQLIGAEGKVKLADSYADRNARTYAKVPVYFSGNEAAKPSQASFKLVIEKNKATVTLEKLIVDKHNDTDYAAQAAPKVTPANVDVISVVAGVDLNDLDLDITKHGDPNAYLKNVKAKAWIKLPENLKSILEWVGEDLSRTYDASEIRQVLKDKADMLAEYGFTHEAIDKVLNLLQKIEDTGIYNYADASLGMDVVFTDNVYPTNPGFYVNMAITADPSYYTAYDYGMIVISPVVALPDRGGVQLTYNGRAEHLFALPSDGTAKELVVTHNGQIVEADVYYYGLNANLAVESGTEAPSLPGAYLASTIYTVKNADGSIQKIGSDMAMLVIGMTDVKLDMDSIIVESDGKLHRPDYTVTTYDGVDVTSKAAVTMISGTVGVDNDENLDLEDLEASVNISFPDAVHEAWKWFAQEMNDQSLVDLPHLNETLSECEITPDTLVRFLKWCKEKLDNNYDLLNMGDKVDALNRWIDREKIEKVKKHYNDTLDKLLAAAEKLVTASEKLNDKIPEEMMKITFEQNKEYKDKGFYLFYGIVTDPDYIPASDAALMVIKDKDDALVLLDTHTPYDGTGKEPFGWDNTKRDGFTMILDKNGDAYGINFLVDDHMTEVLTEFKKETGIDLFKQGGYEVSEIYANSAKKAEELVAKICGGIEEKVISKIETETGKEIAEASKTLLNKYLGELKTKLLGKLNELKESDAVITVNGALPVNEGTYEFYAYSYSIEVAYAELVIEPIHVRVSIPEGLEKVYDGNKATVKPVVSYYSFESIEGLKERQPVEVKRPATVTDAELNLQYTVTTEGIDVGTYPVTITAASIADVENFAKTVDTRDGQLEITKRDITVVVGENIKVNDDGTITAEAYEKFFGDADPEFHCAITPADKVADADGLIFETKRTEGENAGEYAVTAYSDHEKIGNYNVTVKDSTLTIKSATIKVIADSLEKQVNAEEDPEFTYSYEVLAGLDTYKLRDAEGNVLKDEAGNDRYDDDKIYELLSKAPLSVGVARKDPKPENEAVGDTAVLVVNHGESNNVTIIPVDGTLTIVLGDYICWNTATKVYYNDVTDALKAAASGQTVQMLKDATAEINGKDEETIIVYNGLTFDLNGFYVETDNLLSFGVVMDSMGGFNGETSVVEDEISEGVDLTSGGILISNDTTEAWTQVQTENGGFIPVYDTVTGSYKFYSGNAAVDLGIKNGTSASVKFGLRVELDKYEGYYILSRSKDSALDLIAEMTWTGSSAYHIEYRLSANTVRDYATQAYNQCVEEEIEQTRKGISLTISGLDKLGENAVVACKPVVRTVSSFGSEANTMIYNVGE